MNFVLSIVRDNLFVESHCKNFGISWFNNSIKWRGFLFEKKKFVSSAKRISLATDETLQPQVIGSRDEIEF